MVPIRFLVLHLVAFCRNRALDSGGRANPRMLLKFCWEASVKSPLPENEGSRIESLHSFRILGTSSEQGFNDIAYLAALMVFGSTLGYR